MRDGTFIYELMEKVNITFDSIPLVLEIIDKVSSILTEIQSSNGKKKKRKIFISFLRFCLWQKKKKI